MLCGELGVWGRVPFLGYRKDIAALLRAGDFFLLPSTSEDFPLTILEAQESGAIAIAAPTAGIPEVIHGRTGYLVKPDHPYGYADRMEMLLQREDVAETIRRSARQFAVDSHGVEHFARKSLGCTTRS